MLFLYLSNFSLEQKLIKDNTVTEFFSSRQGSREWWQIGGSWWRPRCSSRVPPRRDHCRCRNCTYYDYVVGLMNHCPWNLKNYQKKSVRDWCVLITLNNSAGRSEWRLWWQRPLQGGRWWLRMIYVRLWWSSCSHLPRLCNIVRRRNWTVQK